MDRPTAFAFDTETTGLIDNLSMPDAHLPELIEFYGCEFVWETGEVVREFETFVKPERDIEEIITKITGITDETVKDAPRFPDVAERIQEALLWTEPVLAHNLSYDEDMLTLEFRRRGLDLRLPLRVCTVEQTVHLKGYRLSLGALHETLFGEPHQDAHRARTDVMAMVRCCVELKKRNEL